MSIFRWLGVPSVMAAVAVGVLVASAGTAAADPRVTVSKTGDHTVQVRGHGYRPGEKLTIHICFRVSFGGDGEPTCGTSLGDTEHFITVSPGGDFSAPITLRTDCSDKDDTLYAIVFEQNTRTQTAKTAGSPCHQ